ncbi:MAG: class I SAM-dependent methyltransferase [Chitinophagaceae bacterium]|nr:MAG: class I SAM-dependent methyltransferase [Chitinophagaceae bacterium]
MQIADHSVSKENFELWECGACTLRFTQDVPDEDHIGAYYKSADYISHSNTKTGIVNKLYHRVRNITLSQKQRLINSETGVNKGSLLDIGAGAGTFASFMRDSGWSVTGLEPDEQTRKNALASYNIRLSPSNDLFSLLPGSFDAITMWHVLEHVHDLHGYLDKIHEILKPTGIFFVAVPNYTSKDAEKYQEYWAAYDMPIHLYHFSPASMEQLLKKHGFRLKTVMPMWFDSFYVSMLSEKYKTGKQSLVKGFISGFLSNMEAYRDPKKCSSLIYIAEPA